MQMAEARSKRNLVLAVAAAIAAILQTIGLIRYIQRLPIDWVGICLFAIPLLAFLTIAVG